MSGPHAVARHLDPVLVPLGFAAGQGGAAADGTTGQVLFCRGVDGSPDGACLDLVVDRWHLDFEREAPLAEQLADLARPLPGVLSYGPEP